MYDKEIYDEEYFRNIKILDREEIWIGNQNMLLLHDDNMDDGLLMSLESFFHDFGKPDLIYADMIYENLDLSWIPEYWNILKTNGIFIVQTDYHSVAQVKLFLDSLDGAEFVNWCIYINEWGGTPTKGFPRKHDDILIYAKGKDFYWNKEAIEIPKVTAGTAFDRKGTGLKTPCDVFYDKVSFSTISKERIKGKDGHNITWQKPVWLMERLILPFTKKWDKVLDPFMGSATTGVVCHKHHRFFIGIEKNTEIFKLASTRIDECFIEDRIDG